MSLIEEYYELNEAAEVSALWKATQIAFYISAASFGLGCGYTIALIRIAFEDKCYLFTSTKFALTSDKKIDLGSLNWENDLWCDYCQYSMVSSFIVATIWATFFLMCGKGGKSITGLPQPWRIVWPSLIFNFIYFIVALNAAFNIQEGTSFFCLHPDLLKEKPEKFLMSKCPVLQMLIINDLYTISLQLDIVSKTSWACVVSWLILFLISFFRIIFVIDFHLYKICVFQIEEVGQNKKEEVLKITNYEEQRRIRFDNESNALINLEEKTAEEKIMDESKPVQPNAAFYVITDIRLLRREQQRKKSFKLFDQAFEKNKVSISVKSYKNFILPDANIFPIPSLSCCCFRSLDKFCSRKFKESCFNTQIRIDIVCYYTKI